MSEQENSQPEQPLVSVLMPVWNPHPQHFREALESVLAQTYQNLQILLIEDPSDRDGREFIRDIQDDRITHVRNEVRSSLPEQLNQGLALATAELVARGDADDIWEPHRIAAQVRRFQADPSLDVLGSTLKVIDNEGNVVGYRDYPREHDQIAQAMRRFSAIAHPVVMFKREAVLKVGGYHTDFFVEDYDLWCRLVKAGAKFANDGQPLIKYRVHPEGMKATKLKKQLGESIRMKQAHFQGEMTAADRTRLMGEQILMRLPGSFVYWLFGRMTFSKRPPA